MFDTLPEILTTKEVTKLFRINYRTLLKLIKSKKFPAMRFGGKWIISKQALIELMNNQQDAK